VTGGFPAEDMTGRRFGMLTVVGRVVVKGRTRWRCICTCGGERITSKNALTHSHHPSCGCLGEAHRKAAVARGYSGISQGHQGSVPPGMLMPDFDDE
jgi:hypothetical protein